MKVQVLINDCEHMMIHCGRGKQPIRWLALSVAERYRSMQEPKGRIRQRERNLVKSKGQFLPVDVVVGGMSINPHARIKDVIKAIKQGTLKSFCIDQVHNTEDSKRVEFEEFVSIGNIVTSHGGALHDFKEEEEENEAEEAKEEKSADDFIFHIELVTEMECGRNGVPKRQHTYWSDYAFGYSDESDERMRKFEEEKMSAEKKKYDLMLRKQAEEKRKLFLQEIGLPIDADLVFYNSSEDLGGTAATDWKKVRPVIEKLVGFDNQERKEIRKAILSQYRLLRAGYKLYSGVGNDRSLSAMSFQEFFYLLQDCQICESKDTDLVHRLIANAVVEEDNTTGQYSGKNGGFDRGPRKQSLSSSKVTEMSIDRSTFFDCIVRVLLSEDVFKLCQTRLGKLGDGTSTLPSTRFNDLLNNFVVPVLQEKTGMEEVRHALTQKCVLDVFTHNVVDLKHVFHVACNAYRTKDAKTREFLKRAGSRTSFKQTSSNSIVGLSHTQQSTSKGPGLGLREFMLLLQSLELLEVVQDSKKGTTQASRMTLNASMQTLTMSDCKSLFAASQFEDECEDEEEDSELNNLNFKEFIEAIVRLSIIVHHDTSMTTLDKINNIITKLVKIDIRI